MAIWKFSEAMMNNRPIQVYAEGKLLSDFTYIEDIINGVIAILNKQKSGEPPLLMNIGNNNSVVVNELVTEIEQTLDCKANMEYLPMQPGDVNATYADIGRINSYCN